MYQIINGTENGHFLKHGYHYCNTNNMCLQVLLMAHHTTELEIFQKNLSISLPMAQMSQVYLTAGSVKRFEV